ncbi:hypothetical protein B8V81_4293 [Paenibacillus pasadenensis]|uniref:Uncharacterized protein n=1 Tax=Paenibacillus pasadenensis TaxID=217090 RepID=A0A2N5N6A8_9BACL|nr:hypothetical protein B8V81_4293 [Paenibacillus pasadenensis]
MFLLHAKHALAKLGCANRSHISAGTGADDQSIDIERCVSYYHELIPP